MTQILNNFNHFNFEMLNNLHEKFYILLSIILIIAILGIYFSSNTRKTLIDLGTKVGTAVITGVAAGATKSIMDNQFKGDDSEDSDDKEKNKDKKSNNQENQDKSENKPDSSNNTK